MTTHRMLFSLAMLAVCGLGNSALLAAEESTTTKAAIEIQQKFFKEIQGGDVDKVIELLHPDLMDALDPPVLHTWMGAVKEHLGDVKGISQKGLRGTYKSDKQGDKQIRVLNSAARIVFANGVAQSELWVHEGKIIRFDVKSDKIPDDWIKNLKATDYYRAEGAEFLKAVLEGNVDSAYPAQHETLRKVMTREKLKELAASIKANVGPPKEVTYVSEKIDIQPEKFKLKVRYKVVCLKESTEAVVEFQFLKMEAWIVGFDLTGKK